MPACDLVQFVCVLLGSEPPALGAPPPEMQPARLEGVPPLPFFPPAAWFLHCPWPSWQSFSLALSPPTAWLYGGPLFADAAKQPNKQARVDNSSINTTTQPSIHTTVAKSNDAGCLQYVATGILQKSPAPPLHVCGKHVPSFKNLTTDHSYRVVSPGSRLDCCGSHLFIWAESAHHPRLHSSRRHLQLARQNNLLAVELWLCDSRDVSPGLLDSYRTVQTIMLDNSHMYDSFGFRFPSWILNC